MKKRTWKYMMKKKAKTKKNVKTVAAAVVKGKIYFYCLKEIWNSHTTSRMEWGNFSLSIV